MPLARWPSLRSLYDHSKIARNHPVTTQLISRGDRMRMRVPRSASICLFAVVFALALADESNAQRLTPGMLCSWTQLHTQGSSVNAQSSINAQSQMAPYYGKNQIHYDKFEWYIYKTDHFEIYYYPENERH